MKRRKPPRKSSLTCGRSNMDRECIELCEALNQIEGIRTVESCCGHGKSAYCIWLVTDSLGALPLVAWSFDGCHCGHYGWRVVVQTDCSMAPLVFMIEGPQGIPAYEQSREIAKLIVRTLKDDGLARS